MEHGPLIAQMRVAESELLGFTLLFARFEYALKRSIDFAVGNQNSVQADWDKFSRELAQYFDPNRTTELRSAVEYLTEHAPQKQVLKNGALDFAPCVPRSNEALLVRLLDAIRITRNNLLHGGKFVDGPVSEPARDGLLLESACTVLTECLDLSGGSTVSGLRTVREAFIDGLD